MFSTYKYLIVGLVFPTSIFGVRISYLYLSIRSVLFDIVLFGVLNEH